MLIEQNTDKVRALYEIAVDGTTIADEFMHTIREIRVQDYLALPDLCTFTVGFPQDGKVLYGKLDKHPFPIGATLELKLAPREELVVKSIFKGDIVTLEPNFASGGAELTVRAFDRSYKLTRKRNTKSFENMSASDIVTKVCRAAGLTTRADASPTVFKFIQQSNETDLDFIWRLANRINFEFIVEDSKAIFRPIGSSDPIELEWTRNLTTFTPRMSAVQQVDSVTVQGWDFESKRTVSANRTRPNQVIEAGKKRRQIKDAIPGAETTIVNEPVQDAGEARALAQATLDRLANAYVQAEGSLDGDPQVRSGAMLDIKGVGKQFGGKYRVQSSTHVLRGGSTYETQFSSSSIQTVTGAVVQSKPADFGSQLVIGVVTNNNDPKKMGRVRVKFPTLNNEEGWWARVTQPSAGNQRGTMMMPQVGEEVLVGFEHNDTTRPYVIGSLYNGTDKIGDELGNVDGSYTMRSDKKMTMRAKEEIEVQAGKTYTLKVKGDVTETFDAKWTMSSKGDTSMTIGQMGKLTIIADGNITIQSKMGNIDMSAMQININAKTGLSLNGGVSTKVAGAMIQIG